MNYSTKMLFLNRKSLIPFILAFRCLLVSAQVEFPSVDYVGAYNSIMSEQAAQKSEAAIYMSQWSRDWSSIHNEIPATQISEAVVPATVTVVQPGLTSAAVAVTQQVLGQSSTVVNDESQETVSQASPSPTPPTTLFTQTRDRWSTTSSATRNSITSTSILNSDIETDKSPFQRFWPLIFIPISFVILTLLFYCTPIAALICCCCFRGRIPKHKPTKVYEPQQYGRNEMEASNTYVYPPAVYQPPPTSWTSTDWTATRGFGGTQETTYPRREVHEINEGRRQMYEMDAR